MLHLPKLRIYPSAAARGARVGRVQTLQPRAHATSKLQAEKPQPEVAREATALEKIGSTSAEAAQRMSRASAAGLQDTSFFSSQVPSESLTMAPAKLSPNELGLHANHDGGHLSAAMDRGGVRVGEALALPEGKKVAFNAARNFAVASMGGELDMPGAEAGEHFKVGGGLSANRNALAGGPAFALQNGQRELGVGMGVFAAAGGDVKVLEEAADDLYVVQQKNSLAAGGGIDPRLALQHILPNLLPLGAFWKVVPTQAKEVQFRLSMHKQAVQDLLPHSDGGGPLSSVRKFLSNWQATLFNNAPIRVPEILDPFGEAGGRCMKPYQELTVFQTGSLTWGGGVGASGLRTGYYRSTTHEWEVTITALPQERMRVALSPRRAVANTQALDAPVGPAVQNIETHAQSLRFVCEFDFHNKADVEAYRRIMARGELPEKMQPERDGDINLGRLSEQLRDYEGPRPLTLEKAVTHARQRITGIVRLPFARDGWGGLGRQTISAETELGASDGQGQRRTRTMSLETATHMFNRGISTAQFKATMWRGSPQQGDGATEVFGGLVLESAHTLSRTDTKQLNELAALIDQTVGADLPRVQSTPVTCLTVTQRTTYTGAQLNALSRVLPQLAERAAQASGANVKALRDLLMGLRATGGTSVHRAWQRAELVGRYLVEEGQAGFGALQRLSGERLQVHSESAVQSQAQQELLELRLRAHSTLKQALAVVAKFELALAALEANIFSLHFDSIAHTRERTKLKDGLMQATEFAQRAAGLTPAVADVTG